MTERTIKEVFRNEDGEEYGWYFPLFQNENVIGATQYPEWIRNDTAMQQRIDTAFFSVRARDRVVSPFVERVAHISPRNLILPVVAQAVPLHGVLTIFSDKWDKIHSALLVNYNPLENYSMQETETPNITKTGNMNNSANSAANVYGFNSSSPVPQGSSSGSGGGSTTETETGTRTRTRAGNIGVTSSQMLLSSEIEVRKNILINIICDDIASVLCSPVWRVES